MTKLKLLIKIITILTFLGITSIAATIIYFSSTIPNYKNLANYNPPVTSRLYANDGTLADEFALQKRSYVPIKFIPLTIQNAFLAAEDSNFYNHAGIDLYAITRAMWQNVFRYKEGKNFIGASTITQQVVKNILLTKERTITRKIKEAILAVKISRIMSKERVLELYLNEIYLGKRSYGVATASLNYFNKSLENLSLAESAFLAALPKAPSSLDPEKNYQKALERRNWVINRMFQDDLITGSEKDLALATPIITNKYEQKTLLSSGSFSSYVRNELTEKFGEDNILEEGLVIQSTLNPKIQNIALKSLRKGLVAYDRKNGYRGALQNIDITTEHEFASVEYFSFLTQKLKEINFPKTNNIEKWELAIIYAVNENNLDIFLKNNNNQPAIIAFRDLKWATTLTKKIDEETGEEISFLKELERLSETFNVGDIILVRKKTKQTKANILHYDLMQMPEVNGAVIAINPHNGAINAMVGGYNDFKTDYNRAVQAKRQPGSIIKPFTYLAALENNISPNALIIDDEVRMQKEDGTYWVPMNYSNKFYGPTPMRLGLEKSRNVVTIRLAELVGLNKIADIITRYGISDNPVVNYALILGSDETNLLRITNAYAMIANGGKKVIPTAIEKVQDKTGHTIFKRDKRECKNCNVNIDLDDTIIPIPEINDNRELITDERTAYQAISLLEGAVKRGTGWRARRLPKPIAGKTGTTNDSFDTWFVGFSPDLVVGVWVGFDIPKTMGKKATGSSTALPIFVNIMKEVLKEETSRPFKIPDGIKFLKIDRNTGQKTTPTTLKKDIIFEAFKEENYKKTFQNTLDLNNETEFDNYNTIY
ncbi:MAG: PBP1A family penicillin-binding protein [Alphaproteobacteria bacterium]|jgi:penicillin-binding protein 1A|nr:PBP1A family penicillin-binding protein [Alphaproteobacteria bacterium]